MIVEEQEVGIEENSAERTPDNSGLGSQTQSDIKMVMSVLNLLTH